ncbi:hypothetical protein [Bradyrhizobium sp. LTSP849]|uniref:hypothetical protein n=1 Tax=Bradyrhizobium sp. LTSP849 TaxID=1615890 RepID=UPI000B2F99E0|nr:hypothetical protein [Bradyrhizobium sp. LTSP849]
MKITNVRAHVLDTKHVFTQNCWRDAMSSEHTWLNDEKTAQSNPQQSRSIP